MVHTADGKLKPADERRARLLVWAPWLSFLALSSPLPAVFMALYFGSATADSAAIYLFLSVVGMGLGLVAGLLVLSLLLLYRKRWLGRLRDRLATDGITAEEVGWFTSELSSNERTAWYELKQRSLSLADAYAETLAARLTASRIISRTRIGILRIERQLNRTRDIRNVDTSSLLNDLLLDRARLETLRGEAAVRLSEAKAQLQTIEAAAHRTFDEGETDLMLQRLTVSQQQIPLALELANLEREAMSEIRVRQSESVSEKLDQQSGNPQKLIESSQPNSLRR